MEKYKATVIFEKEEINQLRSAIKADATYASMSHFFRLQVSKYLKQKSKNK